MEASVTAIKVITKYEVKQHKIVKTGIIVESSEINKILHECNRMLKLINK